VIINNLHFERIAIAPDETDAILIVDADTVLSLAISFQCFKMIPWKDCQITQYMSGVYLHKLTLRDSGDLLMPPRALAFK
jgi:hypothetical protein